MALSFRASSDKFASHLVAEGMHSRQTEVLGTLLIPDQDENTLYQQRKLSSNGQFYYFMLAQQVDLENVKEGQVLAGPIVESKVGEFEPKNIIIKEWRFTVERVLLNIENPFFKEVNP